MKHLFRFTFLLLMITLMVPLNSCSNQSYKVKVVKPRKHYGWFDSKKDKKKKRTKVVRYKVHRGIKY